MSEKYYTPPKLNRYAEPQPIKKSHLKRWDLKYLLHLLKANSK